jgi:hypothetical protein
MSYQSKGKQHNRLLIYFKIQPTLIFQIMKNVMSFIFLFALCLGMTTSLFAQNELTAAQLKQIEVVMAPVRAKVNKVLAEENAALLKQYHVDTAQVRKIKDAKQYKAALSALETKYMAFMKKGYSDAKVDETALKAQISNIIPKDVKYKFGPFLSIVSISDIPAVVASANGCLELKCPFDVKNTNKTGSLISIGVANANDCGVYTSGFSDLAGAGDAIAFSGKKATIPANKTKVKVTATENYSMNGTAWAVLGGAYVESSVGVRAQGPSVNKTFTFKTNWAVAPVIWFSNYEETAENTDINMSFAPSAAGGDYTIQVFAKSYSFAGAAFAAPTCYSFVYKVAKIKVCWE